MAQLALAQLTALNGHGPGPRRILSGECSALAGTLLLVGNAKIVCRDPLIRRRMPVGLRDFSGEIISVRLRIAQAGDMLQQILKTRPDSVRVFGLVDAIRSIRPALHWGARRAGSRVPLRGVELHQVCGYSI